MCGPNMWYVDPCEFSCHYIHDPTIGRFKMVGWKRFLLPGINIDVVFVLAKTNIASPSAGPASGFLDRRAWNRILPENTAGRFHESDSFV